jgi:hypothetical protein
MPVATAAAFSPDQSKIFLLTSQGMYVYSTVDALRSVPMATSATDVKFSGDGSFAYVSGNPAPGNSISAFATCNAQQTHHDPSTNTSDLVTTPGIPLQIFPSPNGQQVLALDPSNDSVDIFTTAVKQTPLPDGQFVCNGPAPAVSIAPLVNFPNQAQSVSLGLGQNFTPLYTQLVGDGSAMIIVAQNVPAVIVYNVANGTTSSVPLARPGFGSSYPLVVGTTPQQGITPASASTDGSQVAVAACDQYAPDGVTCSVASVHIVVTCGVLSCNVPPALGQGDVQQVPYINANNNDTNMCNNNGNPAPQCQPNMVAIRPQ